MTLNLKSYPKILLNKDVVVIYANSSLVYMLHLICFTLFLRDAAGMGSGESIRLPRMWPRYNSQIRRHMWVEFVGSLLCSERFFSGYSGSGFALSSKTNI